MAKCDSCGAGLTATEKVCSYCGALNKAYKTVQTPTVGNASSSTQKTTDPIGGLGGVIGGAVIGGAILGGLFRPRGPRRPGPMGGPRGPRRR